MNLLFKNFTHGDRGSFRANKEFVALFAQFSVGHIRRRRQRRGLSGRRHRLSAQWMHQAYSRNHLVQAAGKYTQHSNRIGLIDRLVEDRAIHYYDRVGAQNGAVGISTRNGQRLLTGQSLSASTRGLARVWSLVHISRLGIEWNTRIAQKFLAS